MFTANENAPQSGTCRRYPPTVVVLPPKVIGGDSIVASAFPPTQAAHICGEFHQMEAMKQMLTAQMAVEQAGNRADESLILNG